ncbi:MAG TPA: type II toxin-antitoxin system VapC family toxin [Parachlamydiaceae bacterium]|nr:type II toxin-antitoxin system VapC family toxin [Parachlamydiaceae bacterium]
MSYLLDTCVVSELRKEVPKKVKEWFGNINEESLFISVVTIGELLDGIERLKTSKKKRDLEAWFFGEVMDRFQGKILPIDENVAKTWGRLSASLREKGISVGVQDLYLAATAHVHALAVLTINTKHFKDVNIPVINPWE